MKRLVDALRPQMRVFVPGLSGESPLLLRELTDDPERARDVDFIGVQFPGIGHADYLSVHPQARQTAFFMSPSIRNGIREQRANLLSLDYSGIARYLQQCEPFELAVGGTDVRCDIAVQSACQHVAIAEVDMNQRDRPDAFPHGLEVIVDKPGH